MFRTIITAVALITATTSAYAEQSSNELLAKEALCERWAFGNDELESDQDSFTDCMMAEEPIFGFDHMFRYPSDYGYSVVARIRDCGGQAVLQHDPAEPTMVMIQVSDWWSLLHLSSDQCFGSPSV